MSSKIVALLLTLGLACVLAEEPRFLSLPFRDNNAIQQGWIYQDGAIHSPKGAIDYIKGTLDDSATWQSFDVIAAATGVAAWDDDPSSGYGNMVIVRHAQTDTLGRRYFTLYAHLESGTIPSRIPKLGRRNTNYQQWADVNVGDQLGRAGQTGYTKCATNNCIHLHFEVHAGGYYQNQTDAYRVFQKRAAYPGPCTAYLWTFCPPDSTQPPPSTCPPNFFDSFDRSDGPVGNGWLNTAGNANGNLVIQSGALSTPGPDGSAGTYRPINMSVPVTLSATLTHGNGFGGLLNRYTTSFSFNSDGISSTGYGVTFFRGDQNFPSYVFVNGTQFASSFQFGASISTTFTISPNGSITGSVTGSGSTFNFSNGPIPGAFPGSNLVIGMGFPDARSSVITHPTVDDLSIAYSCNVPAVLYSQIADSGGSIHLPLNSRFGVVVGSFTTGNQVHRVDGGFVQITLRETSGFAGCQDGQSLYVDITKSTDTTNGHDIVAVAFLTPPYGNSQYKSYTERLYGQQGHTHLEPNRTYYVFVHSQCSGGQGDIRSDSSGQKFFGIITSN